MTVGDEGVDCRSLARSRYGTKNRKVGVMNSTDCLRRQAELCLRLAELCSDQPLLRHLNFLAARYHETALRTEFGVAQDVEAAE
jgi:hypothetical protein